MVIRPKKKTVVTFGITCLIALSLGLFINMRRSPQADSQTNESSVVELAPPVTQTTNTLDTTVAGSPASSADTASAVEQQASKKKPVPTPAAAPTPTIPMPNFAQASQVTGTLSTDPVCVEGKQYAYTTASYSSYTYTGPVRYTLQLSASGQSLEGFYTQQQFGFDIEAGGGFSFGPNSFSFEYPKINPGASMRITLTTNSPISQQADEKNLVNVCF